MAFKARAITAQPANTNAIDRFMREKSGQIHDMAKEAEKAIEGAEGKQLKRRKRKASPKLATDAVRFRFPPARQLSRRATAPTLKGWVERAIRSVHGLRKSCAPCG